MNGFAKIIERGRGDPVIAQPQKDFVEIELKDFVLGVGALNPQRDEHFLDLAIKGLLIRQEEVFRDLLRNGRGALRAATLIALKIKHRGAQNPLGIDAGMFVEIFVFGRQEGGDDLLRHSLNGDEEPTLARIFCD